MRVVTTGVDIIEVERIKKAINEQGNNFLNRIFTDVEIEYCNKSNNEIKYQHYAVRFAAKEAVFKALSDYIDGRKDIVWKNIEITNEPSGRPNVNIEKLKIENLKSIDISLSHIKDYAIANAVATFE